MLHEELHFNDTVKNVIYRVKEHYSRYSRYTVSYLYVTQRVSRRETNAKFNFRVFTGENSRNFTANGRPPNLKFLWIPSIQSLKNKLMWK